MKDPQNFFEFFGLEPSPLLDEQTLKKKYYDNMRAWHPDLHTLKPKEEQEKMLAWSTFNNRAFQTLLDPDKRLAYLLELHGCQLESSGAQLPPDFLMEMMEWNETLAELEEKPNARDLSAFRQKLEELENQLQKDILPIMQNYNFKSATEEQINALQNFFFKRRYLLRIKEKLATFAPPS